MKEKRFGRIVFIPGTNQGRYPASNSILIDEDVKVIIDTGSDEILLKRLRNEKGCDILINSHYHEDHITSNYLFPSARLYVHKNESACYKSLDAFLDAYGVRGTNHEQYWRDFIVTQFHYETRTPDVEFEDGNIFTFGDTRMEVIHTPGHTNGHSCFYFPDDGILFLGDLDLTHFGPWYGDRVSDIDQTIESMHRVLTIPAEIYITSHEKGIITGDITDLAAQYLRIITMRETALLEYLREPRTIKEIVHAWIVYKKPRNPLWMYEFAEYGNIIKHCERLLRHGSIEYNGEVYYRI